MTDEKKPDGWVRVVDRLPDKDERESCEWWHKDEERTYSGRYESYDGQRIWVGVTYEWECAISIREFSHWRIVIPPIKEGEE
jgi:hypothetical protein